MQSIDRVSQKMLLFKLARFELIIQQTYCIQFQRMQFYMIIWRGGAQVAP